MSGEMDLPRVLAIVRDADAWLDGAVASDYKWQPLAQDWARVAKVSEEAGEAISALIAYSGQNPRKGVCGTREELLGELADAFCTGILAIQHFTKDPELTWAVVSRSLEKLEARAAEFTRLTADDEAT